MKLIINHSKPIFLIRKLGQDSAKISWDAIAVESNGTNDKNEDSMEEHDGNWESDEMEEEAEDIDEYEGFREEERGLKKEGDGFGED